MRRLELSRRDCDGKPTVETSKMCLQDLASTCSTTTEKDATSANPRTYMGGSCSTTTIRTYHSQNSRGTRRFRLLDTRLKQHLLTETFLNSGTKSEEEQREVDSLNDS